MVVNFGCLNGNFFKKGAILDIWTGYPGELALPCNCKRASWQGYALEEVSLLSVGPGEDVDVLSCRIGALRNRVRLGIEQP